MTRKNVLIVAAWATGAMALGLAGMLPAPLGAGSDQVKRSIETPLLSVEGAELSIERGEAGLILSAHNTGAKTLAVPCTVQIMRTEPMSPMARVMPRPTVQWQKELLISLAPEESKTLALDAPAFADAGISTVVLISGKQRIVALTHAGKAVQDPLAALQNSPSRR